MSEERKFAVVMSEEMLVDLWHFYNANTNAQKALEQKYSGFKNYNFNPSKDGTYAKYSRIDEMCDDHDICPTRFYKEKKVKVFISGHEVKDVGKDDIMVGCTKVTRDNLKKLLSMMDEKGEENICSK